jgi:hypothetical protein
MKLSKKHVSIFRVGIVEVTTERTEDDELNFVPGKIIMMPHIYADRKEAVEWARENVLKHVRRAIDAGEYKVPGTEMFFDYLSAKIREPKDFDETDFERCYNLAVGGTVTLKSGQRVWITAAMVRVVRERMKLHNALKLEGVPMDCFWREGIAVR